MATKINDNNDYCKRIEPSTDGIVEPVAEEEEEEEEDGSNSSDYQIGSRKKSVEEDGKNIVEVAAVENLKFQHMPVSALNEAERELYYQKFSVLLDKSVYFSDFLLTRLAKSVSKSTKKKKEQSYNDGNNNSSGSGSNNNGTATDNNVSVVCAAKTDNRKKSRSNDEKENEKTKKMKGVENVAKDTYVNEAGVRVSVRQPKLLTGAVMRDYQLDGLEWLVALFENAVNGILADEMGLGKTIQVIALICHLISKKIYGPFLIVAPLSTLPNWMMEFSKFAPKLNVILYHGTEQRRVELEKEFKKSLLDVVPKKKRSVPPIVLTSYEVPLRDKRFLRAVSWGYLIVDEGHRLKNYRSLLSRELRRYRTESRLLLTGTPLQNNLTELWSLLNFILPSIFNDICMFENMLDCSDLEDTEKQIQLLNEEKEKQLISKMHRIIGPFLLRRLKSDVNISLPRKKELLVYTPLTGEQEELYKAILNQPSSSWWRVDDDDKRATHVEAETEVKSSESVVGQTAGSGRKRKRRVTAGKTISYNFDLNDTDDDEDNWCWRNHSTSNGDVDYLIAANSREQQQSQLDADEIVYKRNFSQLNMSMQLRKVVNHPYLVRTPVNRRTNGLVVDENLIRKSGKCLVLDAMLPKLRERGHKVLLFSTFTMLLDMIEEMLRMRDYNYVRLDGSCAIENRLNTIKKFNEDPDTFVFLISTRAGGLGINLTSADTVIIYDSDWNPQVDLQAQDRCHRLGQTKPVVVYRLVTAGTIDEEIVKRAASKRRLEKIIVNEGKFKQDTTGRYESISIEELKKLLQSNDYNKVFRSTGNVFSETDLQHLLDRSDLIDNSQAVNVNQLSQQQPLQQQSITGTTGSTTNVFKVVENNFSGIEIG